MMTTSDVPTTESNPEPVSHGDKKSKAGAPTDVIRTSADEVKPASVVGATPETKPGDCSDALMRCYNR